MSSGDDRPPRVFVSSTFLDNVERRKIVEDAILGAGLVPVGMERFTASDEPVVEHDLAQVRGCDWFIGIIAYRYGWIPPGQPDGEERSITEMEYDAAKAAGMPCLMFIVADTVKIDPTRDFDEGSDRWKKQELLDRFKEKVRDDQQPSWFEDRQLGAKVFQAIVQHRAREAERRASSDGAHGGSMPGSVGGGVVDDGVSDHELRRYLDKARTLHKHLQLIGFDTNVRTAIQLDELYVPLDAIIDRSSRARDVYAGAQLAEETKEHELGVQRDEIALADAFPCAQQMGKRGVIVLGDPGSGKTTHLKRVLLKVIEDGPESIGLPHGMVPVFLPLRELRDRSGGLPGFIQQQLTDPMLTTAADFGRRLCARGRVLFIFDGLDEVADAEERVEVARWIEQAFRAAPDSMFLVSCRYAGYTRDVELDPVFVELHLRPLDDEQMRRFVTRWYAIVERAAYRDSQQAAVQAKRRAEDLLEALTHTDFTAVARVYEMTRNPLLLTAICLVHRDRGRLPRARAKLYEQCIGVLLERWRDRLPGTQLPVEHAARVLRPVAHWMHSERGRTRATGAELRAPVEAGLDTLGDVKVSVPELLRAIRDDSGLLTGWGVDEYGFMHLGFQEFLTAQHLRNRGLKELGEIQALAQRFGDSWWQ